MTLTSSSRERGGEKREEKALIFELDDLVSGPPFTDAFQTLMCTGVNWESRETSHSDSVGLQWV